MSNEIETTAVETPVAAPAKVKKAKAKKSTPKAPAQVSLPQHRTLVALAKAKAKNGEWMTRKDILKAAFKGGSVNLRSVLDPLVKSKLVLVKELDAEVADGKAETVFTCTAAGSKVASQPAPSRGNGEVSHQPLPKVGKSFTKEYLGKAYTVEVVADGFKVGKTVYSSLTAAAKGVRGSDMEVNGWKFFGLTK